MRISSVVFGPRLRVGHRIKYFTTVISSLAIALTPAAPAFSQALPSGGQVIAGQVNISTPSSNHLLIQQSSPKGIVNWQSFSIGQCLAVH